MDLIVSYVLSLVTSLFKRHVHVIHGICYLNVVICDGRHVVLPRELAKQVPKSHLMSEDEWRRLGVQQSLGWVHYMIHEPGLYTNTYTFISAEVCVCVCLL